MKCIIYADFVGSAPLCQTPEKVLQEKGITCTYIFYENNIVTTIQWISLALELDLGEGPQFFPVVHQLKQILPLVCSPRAWLTMKG